ncbi:hypothetical protein G6F62_009606 [Rhizopus arrhizus]|nr:hypothetical protein G6F42_001715 [Rhizopus arrhizus]KAG1323535.1 hypothetical protein G6F62_009606 [Rhizopus arrhizus]KAG1372298.1 hypothetical protein G6F61_011182 [Rhizopus arrhizus]
MSLRILSTRLIRPCLLSTPNLWIAHRGYAIKRFTKEHDWISVEDGVGTLGITDYAQKQLGEIVYVEIPDVGNAFTKGEPFGSVESVKSVSEVYAPVSGEVVAVNQLVSDEPEVVNQSAEEDGWLAKIQLKDPKELDALLDEAAYKAYYESLEDEH